jgi:opacity protein-like surface antigen
MKKIILALILALVFAGAATAQDESQPQTLPGPIQVDLGEGNGAVIVVGDGNSIYLPPTKEQTCEPSTAFAQSGGFVLVVNDLVIESEGLQVPFSRVVLWIADDGQVSVVSARQ